MSGFISCGYSHSVAITFDGEVNVWGGSQKNELGVHELKGFEQHTPYRFPTEVADSTYQAIEVGCGESHTALLLKDVQLPPIKLIYSYELPISSIMEEIKTNLLREKTTIPKVHKKWRSPTKLSKDQVNEFFQTFITTSRHRDHISKLVDLMMSKGKEDQILYKEFRDQVYGCRMDDGRVMTWGEPLGGRLGRLPEKRAQEKEDLVLDGKVLPGIGFVDFPEDVTITRIACGEAHTLAISDGRKLYAWGTNAYGQLGLGDTDDRPSPCKVHIDAEYLKDIAGGGAHSMVLDNDGHIFSWGLGEGGRLGHGESNLELMPKKLETIKSLAFHIAAGHSHSGCLCDGEIYTWGKGSYGRLGHGSLNNEIYPKSIDFFKGKYIQKLCLSVFHSAVLMMNGEVYAWGNSKNGRLGRVVSNSENVLVPTRVGVGSLMMSTKIIDLALGFKHGLAMDKNGTVFSWGCNNFGMLGIDTKNIEEPIPKEVKGIKKSNFQTNHRSKKKNMPLYSLNIIDVIASDFNTILLTDAGQLLVWGSNQKGQLGCKISESHYEEEIFSSIDTKEVRATYPTHKKLTEGEDSYTPIFISKLRNEKIIQVVSRGEYSLALNKAGEVWGWGNNAEGQLAIGCKDTNFEFKPVQLNNFKRIKIRSMAAGNTHSAFITDSGQLYMCGNVESGKLGLGEEVISVIPPNQFMPRLVTNIPNIKKISCGLGHTAALDFSYQVWTWGSGWFGKLGHGNTEDCVYPKVVLNNSIYPPSTSALKQVVCGEFHTLLLNKDGTVYGAGLTKIAGLDSTLDSEKTNFHKLEDIRVPVKYISAGRDHSLAVTVRGQIYGWGKITKGKLGAGPFKTHDSDNQCAKPHQIIMSDDTVFERVGCGMNHSVAMSEDSKIYAWGSNGSGRLGLGELITLRKNYDNYLHKEDDEGDCINVPLKIMGVSAWLQDNKNKMSDSKPSTEVESEYLIQSLIKNEPVDNTEEALLSEDQKIVFKLKQIIDRYDVVKEIEEKRKAYLSGLENLLMSKIETYHHLPNLSFKLTMPPFICKNIQVYEYLIAALQTHPCYLAEIIKENPNLPAAETADIFTSIYGELGTHEARLRRLMVLYKLVLKNTVARSNNFKRSLRVKTGDLSSFIYFKLLGSQECNVKFFRALVGEIIGIIYKATKVEIIAERLVMEQIKNVITKMNKDKEDIDQLEEEKNPKDTIETLNSERTNIKSKKVKRIKTVRFLDPEDRDVDIDCDETDIISHKKSISKGSVNSYDALNYKLLEEMEDRPPELTKVLNQRKIKFYLVAHEVCALILGALEHSPKYRARFTADIKISNEIKFLFKDIPHLFFEKFPDETRTVEGQKILQSKIVSLFFLSLLELLREPVRLKETHFEEVLKSLRNSGIPDDYSFDDLIRDNATNIRLIADYIELVGERGKTEDQFNSAEYIDCLVRELTDVADFDMSDLMLGDLLKSNLDHRDQRLSITIDHILSIHELLWTNIDTLRNSFGVNDPVVQTVLVFGDITKLVYKLKRTETRTFYVNLQLPTRWLLRERCVMACTECKTPLTYSLLKHKPEESLKFEALAVPEEWVCSNCGNLQQGWNIACTECRSKRRDFPFEALNKFYVPDYESDELRMFLNILAALPTIPSHVPISKYLKNMEERLDDKNDLKYQIKVFKKMLKDKGNQKFSEEKRIKEELRRLELEAEREFKSRSTHRAYIDSMKGLLGSMDELFKLELQHFDRNTETILKQAESQLISNSTSQVKKHLMKNKTQGRFTVYFLLKTKVIENLELPESLRKKTFFIFTEQDGGSFDVRVILHESRDWLCLPRTAREAKLFGFEISGDKMIEMRRTMNYRSLTSFEGGKVSFNVFNLMKLLSDLLGNTNLVEHDAG